jgi:hypothetical protein
LPTLLCRRSLALLSLALENSFQGDLLARRSGLYFNDDKSFLAICQWPFSKPKRNAEY